MAEIIIESPNPLDMEEEDIRSLAEVLSPAFPDYRIGYAYHTHMGLGVTWPEVLNVWLPAAAIFVGKETLQLLVNLAADWIRARLQREQVSDGAHKRPKYVGIYGPRGEMLASVEVMDETLPPEVVISDGDGAGGKQMPPIQGYFDDLNRTN